MLRLKSLKRSLLNLLVVSILSTRQWGAVEATGLSDVLWRDPGDVASLNLVYGIGGEADAPDPKRTYTFVKEDTSGTNPKFEIQDQNGTKWRVKLGEESRPETAASRLLWAAGYFVDEDYYLSTITVTGLPALHRGGEFVSPGGVVHGAALERHLKQVNKMGNWSWFENPFRQTREFNGLRVMMALLNNWDLKNVNNSVDEMDGECRYLVSDLGATLGGSGNYFTRSKSAVGTYGNAKFIDRVTADSVDFVMHTRPFALAAVRLNYYRHYAHMEDIVRRIPRADAKWLGQRLGQLSEAQLRDCFMSAGFSTEEASEYVSSVRKRIADLNAL